MMKIKFKISLLLLSVLCLTSCSKNDFHISLFIYNSSDTFMKGYSELLVSTLENNYKVSTYYAEGSQSYQNDQILNELYSEDNKLLLVNLVDRLAAKTIIEKATSLNKPLIFLNRQPLANDLKSGKNCYYIGAKPESDGQLQAEIINEYFISNENFINSDLDKNKNGLLDIILIKGEQGHQDTENRSRNAIDTLMKYGYQVNILNTSFCDWNRIQAEEYIAKIYDEYHSDIDLVISNNDDMALGVIDYLKKLSTYQKDVPLYESYFPIIGVDATSVGLEAIQNHEMYGTVKNDYEKQVEIITTLIPILINNGSMIDFPFTMDSPNCFQTSGIKISQRNYLNL